MSRRQTFAAVAAACPIAIAVVSLCTLAASTPSEAPSEAVASRITTTAPIAATTTTTAPVAPTTAPPTIAATTTTAPAPTTTAPAPTIAPTTTPAPAPTATTAPAPPPCVDTIGIGEDDRFLAWVQSFGSVNYEGHASGWWVDENGSRIGWSAAEDDPICVTVWPTPEVATIDPPTPEVAASIAECEAASGELIYDPADGSLTCELP